MKLIILILLGLIQSILTQQKSYEGAQLLRIFNSSILNTLTDNYGGNVWKDTLDYLDVSFEKENLNSVDSFLKNSNIEYEIKIPNIQDLFSNPTTNEFVQSRSTSTAMSWTNYQTYTTIINWLNSLPSQYPNIASIINIGSSFLNKDLLVLRITNNATSNNNAIWIDGGIHAREWVSPSSVTYIANYLLQNWNSLPTKLNSKTWYILSVMNPDGYDYTWTSDRLWRKNRRTLAGSTCVGVDLNRNFNIDWNSSSQSTDKCSETYKGTAPFSEKETNSVRTFLTNNKNSIKGLLTFHSYGQYILWPWGYTYAGAAPNAANMENVAKTAASNIKALTGSTYTAVRDTALGLIAGATDDWAKSTLNTSFTYTVELRDTGSYGFVLPASQIIPTAQEALEVVKAVANAI